MRRLDNAFDAVEVGGHVSGTVEPEGNGVIVRVLDDGHGSHSMIFGLLEWMSQRAEAAFGG